ncbi:MAG: glycoside hydrolase [Candidatus Hydrogenedens sp.]|nr:glycoside hydrolase [Candidatus Hydrogenedens sp.]
MNKILLWLFVIILYMIPTALYTEDSNQTPVFKSGEEGYDTFRIPSLIKTKQGSLIAFCEGRKDSVSDSGNIDLICRRSEDDGNTWGPLQVIWDDDKNTCGNPCAVIDSESGTIILLMTWNLGEDSEPEIIAGKSKDTRRVFISRSVDDGQTWTKPEEITSSTKHADWTWYATGPGIGIQLESNLYKNRIIIPCDHANKKDNQWYSHVIFSDDGGKTWNYSQPIGPKQNECQVVEIQDGKLLLNMRNYNREYPCRAISISSDGGTHWGDINYDLTLVEPVCQASLIKHKRNDKEYLAFSNPADKKERINMTVRISDDYGKTWKYNQLVYSGPSAYSCLCSLNKNEIGILFECGMKNPYEQIVFKKLNIRSLIKED